MHSPQFIGLSLFLGLIATPVAVNAWQAQPAPNPTQTASQADRQKMMDLLHITSLRNGANGSNPQAPNYANYDESKANPYPTLPDPLVMKNGKKVTTAKMWWDQRRPEIVEDFDREIYGRMPKVTPPVKWEVVNTTNETNGDVPVITKQLVGHVDNSSYPADHRRHSTIPLDARQRDRPRPGHHGIRLSSDPRAAVVAAPAAPHRSAPGSSRFSPKAGATRPSRPPAFRPITARVSPRESSVSSNKGEPRKPDDWGALRAWAWGASRALDYFETDKAVDAKRVGIEGHSRYGKATAVTLAYDQRFAVAFVSSSGEGGVKLHRRNWGELVENVAATNEYHWMAGNFLKYAGPLNWNDLPVDSHELVALCAPRPVFISAGATEWRRMGRRQRHVPRRCRRGAGLQTSGQERHGNQRISRRSKPRLSMATWLSASIAAGIRRPQLAHIHRLCGALSENPGCGNQLAARISRGLR